MCLCVVRYGGAHSCWRANVVVTPSRGAVPDDDDAATAAAAADCRGGSAVFWCANRHHSGAVIVFGRAMRCGGVGCFQAALHWRCVRRRNH